MEDLLTGWRLAEDDYYESLQQKHLRGGGSTVE
jgi:hypothetical protein